MSDTHGLHRRGGMSRRGILGLLGCAGVALVGGSAVRKAVAAVADTVITGTQEDTLVSDGCTSPVGYCGQGTFRGNRGFQGASSFRALAFDPIPNDPLGRLAVSGEATYTTKDGQITVSDVAVWDVDRGTSAGIGRIVSGTGSFSGATGDVFTHGHISADGQSFTRAFTIEINVPT